MKAPWFFKYKLYHIPFWFVYHTIWWVITIGSITEVANNIFNSVYAIKFAFYVVFQAIAVYFNLYVLIPKLLYKRKYVVYIASLLCVIGCTAVLIVSGYYLSAYLSDTTFEKLYFHKPDDFMHFFSINALPSTVASITLGMSVKLAKNWIESERKRQFLEKEKLETELKYLKAQLNPHFLFNTINSIFVLIHKNPDLASDSLATFSSLMRYQLYECNDNEIELEKELSFLDNFIQLERLRLDETYTDLSFEVKNKSTHAHQFIAPFLLIPFVENAFKHVSKGKIQKNMILISLEIEEDKLSMVVENTMNLDTKQSNYHLNKGIGLKNVQRRLDLVYANRYQLEIKEITNCFYVKLDLPLTQNYKNV